MSTADTDSPSADPPARGAEAPAPRSRKVTHHDLFRDLLRYFPGVVLPRLAGFISVPIVTRLFPPEIYGTYALVLASIAVLGSAALSGLNAALLRFQPAHRDDPRAEERLLSTVFAMAGFISITVVLIGMALLAATDRFSKRFGVLMAFGLLLFFANGILGLLSILLRSRRKAGVFSVLQLLSGYGGLAIGLSLILGFGFGIQGLIIGNTVAAVIGIVLAWRFAVGDRRIGFDRISRQTALEVFRFSGFISLGNAAYWLLSMSDRWLLRLFRGAEEVGLYSVSYDLTSKTTMLFVAAFGLALQPLSISAWEAHGREATEAFLAASTRMYVLVMLPATVGLGLLGNALVGMLAASEYQPGAVIVPFVAAAMFLYGLLDIAGRGLTLNKRPDIEARNFALAGVLVVILNLLFLPRFGILAAAVTTFAGYLALLLLHARSVQVHAIWRFPWATLARCAGASAGMSAAVLAVKGALSHAPRGVDVLAAVVTGAATYGLAIVALGEVPPARVKRWLLGRLQP